MGNFPKKLLTEMYDLNITFDGIIFIPTLVTLQKPTDLFSDFIEDAYNDNQSNKLLEQCPSISNVLKLIKEEGADDYPEEIAQELLNQCGECQFLVLTQTAIPYSIRFNDKGNHSSHSIGGYFQMEWIIAKDMESAARIALAHAELLINKKVLEAKRDQGLVV